MQRISITNPQNIIDGTAKKYYFKLRNTGGPKGDKGDKGDTGSRGPQGEPGDPCTVVVNSTATLEPGSNAYVTNTGSLSNAVLNFGIPQGPRGPQGVKGDPGEPGQKGEPGPRGVQGERGTNATVYVGTTSTLNPGSQATVYNSGTDSNAVLNFGIPKGEKGDTGSQGPTGPAGQNFAPTIVAELPTTGAEGKLYLTPKAHTTSTATGNPITATVAEDAGTIESFQLDGDTFQQTYTGKNLCGIPDQAFTTQGVTVTIKDGEVTLNGTSTGTVIRPIPFIESTVLSGDYTTTLIYVSGNKSSSSANINLRRVSDHTLVSGTQTDIKGENAYRTYSVSNESVELGLHIASNGVFNNLKFKVQIVAGSTADYDFEPYVGGQPSPSPDYPEPIQTVTGTQTVEIVGKNQYPFNDTIWSSTQTSSQWCFQNGATNAYGADVTDRTYYKITLPAGIYTMTAFDISSNIINVQACANGESVETIVTSPFNINSDNPSSTITLTETTTLCVRYRITNPSLGIGNTKIQIELGSTATAYAPYSKQTLPLDLGSLELCKLGAYQDYIYENEGKWYVHKEIGKVVLDSTYYNSRYGTNSYGLTQFLVELGASDYYDTTNYVNMLSSSFIKQTTSFSNTQVQGFLPALDSNFHKLRAWIRISTTTADTTDQFKAWLNTNTPIFYYKLNTATDTTITDTTLIAQLEAIRTASLQNGTNTITNSATGSNLAGDMEIGYYGYNPTNRYDKWLWLDINNNYEQIGS